MKKEEYIQGVMQKMNELGWADEFVETFAGSDTTNIEANVERSYMSAWRKGVFLLPKRYFRQASLKEQGRHYYSLPDGTGCVALPEDFYALSSFRMHGWQKAVYNAVDETDDVAQVQANEFIRGNYELPVCTLSSYAPLYAGMPPEGNDRMMRYYSLPKGFPHRIEFGFYVPLTRGITGLDWDERIGEKSELYEPLEWIHAGVVFSILGRADQAKGCDGKALEVVSSG